MTYLRFAAYAFVVEGADYNSLWRYPCRHSHGSQIPQTEIGILGRRSNASREETFRKLGIRVEPGVKYLLYSFGSHSFPIYNNFQQVSRVLCWL
jgi:hypothetical protein